MLETLPAEIEAALGEWLYPQRKRLAELASAEDPSAEELGAAVRRLTEAAARTLRVERASVWRIEPDGLRCVDLYEATPDRHSAGLFLPLASAPAYFTALGREGVIAAADAVNDPRTREFAEGYLAPLGIGAMLDAPVFVRGRALAVTCQEHVGASRDWEYWEELVASTLADFVATVFEIEARGRDVAARRARQEELERRVEERTRELRESEASLQTLLDASPVPLVLTRATDHKVVYANARAYALFEIDRAGGGELHAPDFWVTEEDRQAFVKGVLGTGRVDDLVVRLKTANARVFWARMSAQAMRYRGEVTLLGGMIDITDQITARKNLHDIFSNAPVALVISRLADSVLIDGNQWAADLFEIDVASARGRPAPDFWAVPEDRERLRQLVAAEGRVERFEAELVTASGRRFWAELSAGVILHDGAPALLVGGHEISWRKQAEDALRRSESTLRTLLDAAPMPLVVTGLDDGMVRYCNEPAAALFALPSDHMVGRKAPDFYQDPATRAAFVDALRRDGQVEGFSARLVTSAGRPFWALMGARTFELDGEAVFVVGFAEVTAQKELEERLASEVARAVQVIEHERSVLEATLEAMLDGVVVVDWSGQVTRVNAAMAELLGGRPEDFDGAAFATLLAPNEGAFARELAERVNAAPLRGRETWFRRRDGEALPLSVNASVQRDGGSLSGIVVVARDDRALRQAQARLQMTDRLAAMGTVAAGVAHEINNPLAFVLSNLEFVVDELKLSEGHLDVAQLGEVNRALEASLRGADRVRQIVKDLKTFSRANSDSIDRVDVNRLLDSSIAMMKNELRHHARLVKAYGAVPSVSASEAKLGQVFINLLQNAAHAIPPGRVEENEVRVTSALTAQGEVAVEVTDTGAGIAPEVLPRIFDAFFTTKPVGVGTGLGLAICHQVVASIGGRIEVQSRVGEGTTFRVILPPAPQVAPLDVAAPATARAVAPRRRILVVDDEVDIGQSLRRMLGRTHDVDVVTRAAVALDLLGSTPYDVVLCDLMMPEMTGMELYQHLRGARPDLVGRLVFMTGGAFSPGAGSFLDSVPNRWLEKPVDADTLRRLLAEVAS